jgi:hypothetical protein
MQVSAGIIALLCFCGAEATASEFPVTHARDAIRIAREVCRDKDTPAFEWHAYLDQERQEWMGDDAPSICAMLTNKLWTVDIPVNGPRPTECLPSMYELICPPKSN